MDKPALRNIPQEESKSLLEQVFPYIFFATALIVSAVMVVVYFQKLNIEGTTFALDWSRDYIKNGDITYGVHSTRNPPWSLLPLLPLGFLPDRAGWGMLVYINVVILILSVPRTEQRWRHWLGIFLAVTAFPSLRTSVDGNFEILVLAGALLCVAGYALQNPYVLAAGFLVVTAKPQAASLFVLTLGFYCLMTLPPRKLLVCGALIALIVIPTFIWRGEAWIDSMRLIPQRGSIMDITLDAGLKRTELVPEGVRWACRIGLAASTLVYVWFSDRSFTRFKGGMLLAVSLLIAPYASGNSVLSVMGLGVIALLFARPLLGAGLMALIDLPYVITFVQRDWLYDYQSYYWTSLLLIIWGVLMWTDWRMSSTDAARSLPE